MQGLNGSLDCFHAGCSACLSQHLLVNGASRSRYGPSNWSQIKIRRQTRDSRRTQKGNTKLNQGTWSLQFAGRQNRSEEGKKGAEVTSRLQETNHQSTGSSAARWNFVCVFLSRFSRLLSAGTESASELLQYLAARFTVAPVQDLVPSGPGTSFFFKQVVSCIL